METMDHLLQRKEEGRGFYHKLGAQSAVAGFRRICGLLASDEMRQEKVLLDLRQGRRALLEEVVTLDEAKVILRRMCLNADGLGEPEGESHRLGKAMEFEAGCARICRNMAAGTDGNERELLLRMAAQEEMHFTLLEQMRELVEQQEGSGDSKW